MKTLLVLAAIALAAKVVYSQVDRAEVDLRRNVLYLSDRLTRIEAAVFKRP